VLHLLACSLAILLSTRCNVTRNSLQSLFCYLVVCSAATREFTRPLRHVSKDCTTCPSHWMSTLGRSTGAEHGTMCYVKGTDHVYVHKSSKGNRTYTTLSSLHVHQRSSGLHPHPRQELVTPEELVQHRTGQTMTHSQHLHLKVHPHGQRPCHIMRCTFEGPSSERAREAAACNQSKPRASKTALNRGRAGNM